MEDGISFIPLAVATTSRSALLLTRSYVAGLLGLLGLPECITRSTAGPSPATGYTLSLARSSPDASQDGKATRKRSFSIRAGLRWEMSPPPPRCTSGQLGSAVVHPSA